MSVALAKVNKYRRLLDIVADNPDLFDDGFAMEWYGISVYIYPDYDDSNNPIADSAKRKLAETVKRLRRASHGDAQKGTDDYTFYVDVNLPDIETKFRVRAARDNVCTKEIVGTETVTEIDYESAPKKTVTRDIVKWECGVILDGE